MIGQNVQNYTITAYLGEGGMGTVYKASDTMLGREVALKMLHGTLISQPQFLERFKKEARVLAQLLHPNIAVIYNFIGQDNNHFMVMEYVEGNNLDALLRKHKLLPYNIIVPMFLQVLEGLHHAHKKGIFHRDIKPSNLILTPDATVKLMDFGIAKIAGEQRMTQVNRVVGTIEYMAPELIEGKDPSIASDIYATGVTMYEMLTGKLPFEGNTDYTLMQDIMKKKPVSVDKLNAAVPASLSNIVMKALEKKPEHRYHDAKTFQLALMHAFPQLKEIDLNQLNKPVVVTQQAQVITQPKKKIKPTVLHSPLGNATVVQRSSALQTIRQKIFTKEKAPVLLGIASLLLAGVILIIHLSTKKTIDQSNQTFSQNQVSKLDSGGENVNNNAVTANTTDTLLNTAGITVPLTADAPERRNNQVIIPDEEKKKDVPGSLTTEKKKEASAKDIKKQTENKNTEPPKEEKKEPLPVKIEPVKKDEFVKTDEPAKKAAQSIRLNNRLEVDLYLRDAISEATAKEGQLLHFTVSNPVFYNGEMIITKGAAATGRIKNIGKKKISIVLTSVNSAGGQSIPFETVELSGRIEEIISARNYSGTLRKGTVINF